MRPFEPAVALGFVFALGCVVGSFLNVVIYRVPRDESIVRPRSRCPKCGRFIPSWGNVPLLSYLVLRGRCAYCRAPISLRYPLVEALTGALFVGAWLWGEQGPRVLVDWALLSALVAITFIDLDHQIIPDAISLPGIAIGLALSLLWPPASWQADLPYIANAVLGAGVGYGMLWMISAGYERFTGRIGLGRGDVKLVSMLGAFLGLEAVLGIMVIGSLMGLAHGIAFIVLRGGDRQTRIPFGPALAAAGALFVLRPELLLYLFPDP